MNAPNRFELYVLEDGEKTVEVTEDTKIPNAATFKIVKQDHTLGNMLRAQVLSMPQVLFAGYKVPHPLHPYFLLKIQTDWHYHPASTGTDARIALIAMDDELGMHYQISFVKHTKGIPLVTYSSLTPGLHRLPRK
ncbi:DNA-directed RNA polymerase, partial [Chiua virens]